jgi:hypothetical protein
MISRSEQRRKVLAWAVPFSATACLVGGVIFSATYVMARNTEQPVSPAKQGATAAPASPDSLGPPVALVPIRSEDAEAAGDASGRGGMQAFVDPETGEMRTPTAAELAQLQEEAANGETDGLAGQKSLVVQDNFSGAGLVEQHFKDGSVMVDLQGRFRHTATVTIAADGTLNMDCDSSCSSQGTEHQHAGGK